MPLSNVSPDLLAYVERLHGAVDELVRPLEERHAGRLRCGRGCSGCCVDGLTVFELEAAAIAEKHGALLREGEPHAEGACAFLDAEGGCRIYAERPYVCRTQGLPLRWLEPAEEGEEGVDDVRDICPLNAEGGPPLEALDARDCWTLGPIEQRLGAAQAKVPGGEGRRVSLRGLWRPRG